MLISSCLIVELDSILASVSTSGFIFRDKMLGTEDSEARSNPETRDVFKVNGLG